MLIPRSSRGCRSSVPAFAVIPVERDQIRGPGDSGQLRANLLGCYQEIDSEREDHSHKGPFDGSASRESSKYADEE